MRNVIKIGFPILCVAVIVGTFILLGKTTDRINRLKLNENEVVNKTSNETLNETSNEISKEVFNTNSTTNTLNEVQGNVVLTEEEKKAEEVKNKAKAIDLVKKKTPPESDCYYTNEGTLTDGKYVVAIRDNETKNARIYYSVDLNSEQVKLYEK